MDAFDETIRFQQLPQAVAHRDNSAVISWPGDESRVRRNKADEMSDDRFFAEVPESLRHLFFGHGDFIPPIQASASGRY
jgi:hypothetical protein